MKLIHLFLLFLVLSFSTQCQDRNSFLDTIRLGRHANPLILLDGDCVNIDYFNKYNINNVGIFIIEGDSSFMNSIKDTSVLKKYYGEEVNRGVILMFTKNKVINISDKALKQYLNRSEIKTLWSIDSHKLTTDNNKIKDFRAEEINSIKLIKAVKFKNKSNQCIDIRNIVVVDFKNKNFTGAK